MAGQTCEICVVLAEGSPSELKLYYGGGAFKGWGPDLVASPAQIPGHYMHSIRLELPPDSVGALELGRKCPGTSSYSFILTWKVCINRTTKKETDAGTKLSTVTVACKKAATRPAGEPTRAGRKEERKRRSGRRSANEVYA